jgi:hypothetical protein
LDERILALYVVGMGRVPVDSPIEVVHREKASFKIGLGWSYRFQSNGEWLLIPLEQVVGVVFSEKPKGFNPSASKPKGTPQERLSAIVRGSV